MPKNVQTLPDGKICDFIDQKIRNDTPEEYVRQNIERRLVLELGYSPEQIAVEFPIKIGSRRVRVDLVVFPEGREHTQDHACILIECKRDSVEPTSRRDGVEQLKSYMSACPNGEWGMWTNGKFKEVFRLVRDKGASAWEEPNDIPSKGGDVEEVDRPKRETLKNATDDNLLFSFKICHNHIYVTDGLHKQSAFFELLKVIFCKIHDERNVPHPLHFFATAKEKTSPDGRLTVARRIGRIFDDVKKRYPAIFDAEAGIRLQPRSLAYVVGELQRYSFLDTHIDVKGKAYEELVGANLRGDRGEFFTPRNVQRMAIQMLDIAEGERILDPACGTGGFLVIAMNEMIEDLRAKVEASGVGSEGIRRALTDRIQDLARRCFFGVDINPDLVKATKMNMVMNNDGSGNIFRQDTLLHGLSTEAHNAFRFKRYYVDSEVGVPFLSSSDIINLRGRTDRFLSRSRTPRVDELYIQLWDVLITRSGTIGNVALAGSAVTGMALSEHAIRCRCSAPELAGYVTAVLRSRLGRLQMRRITYGSVVTHIEPDHLRHISVPDLHPIRQAEIGQAMCDAVSLRDKAGRLFEESLARLYETLSLAPLRHRVEPRDGVPFATVRASELQMRFDVGFHRPRVHAALDCLDELEVGTASLEESGYAKEIRQVTKFRKRTYVREGGLPLLNSKQLFQVDPIDMKSLAKGAHQRDLEEIGLDEDMILVTCSGTIGRVQIVPRYMAAWSASQDAIRIIAAQGVNPGFLFTWLDSEYGQELVTRFTYGSVVTHIDREMLGSVPVPLLTKDQQDHIGEPVMKAKELWDGAWNLERSAIAQIDALAAN